MTLIELMVAAAFGCILGAVVGAAVGMAGGDIGNAASRGALIGLLVGLFAPASLVATVVNWNRFRTWLNKARDSSDD
jgi:hypothetical protein